MKTKTEEDLSFANANANVGAEEQRDAGGTCSVSSQQASGERHVSKKSFPARNSRNSGCHNRFSIVCYGDKSETCCTQVINARVAFPGEKLGMSTRKATRTPLTWQVPSRLPHAPHRDVLGLFAACRSQECVVLELREVLRSGGEEGGAEKKLNHHPYGTKLQQISRYSDNRKLFQHYNPSSISHTRGRSVLESTLLDGL